MIIASLEPWSYRPKLFRKLPDARLANFLQTELTEPSMMAAANERNAADGTLWAVFKDESGARWYIHLKTIRSIIRRPVRTINTIIIAISKSSVFGSVAIQ